MSLLDEIDGARLVVVDEERRLAYAWFGGTGVNVYDEDGNEVDYFTMGGNEITPRLVEASIPASIAESDEDEMD